MKLKFETQDRDIVGHFSCSFYDPASIVPLFTDKETTLVHTINRYHLQQFTIGIKGSYSLPKKNQWRKLAWPYFKVQVWKLAEGAFMPSFT